MIKEGSWSDSSGKLLNPGKTFILKLAAASVRRVNEMRDKSGLLAPALLKLGNRTCVDR
jgi:hypothetical protein